jgi:hypothetical protein
MFTSSVFNALHNSLLTYTAELRRMLAVPLLGQFAVTSLWRPGFTCQAVHMDFSGKQKGIGTIIFQVIWFSPVSIIPLLLQTHTYIWGMEKVPLEAQFRTDSLASLQKQKKKWMSVVGIPFDFEHIK